MAPLICCTSIGPIGCTFMDWSIHFLSGQNKFFHAKQNKWLDLSINPILSANAHGHQKNHPSGYDETVGTIESLAKQNALVSYYPMPIQIDWAAERLGIDYTKLTNSDWQRIQNYCEEDYNRLLKFSASRQAKIVFVSIDSSSALYLNTQNRAMSRMLFNSKVPDSVDELREEFDQVFFEDSVHAWNQLGLNDIWDIRERLALSRSIEDFSFYKVDFSFEHYWVDSQTWWYNGKQEIQKIMAWLELPVVPDRFESWIPIYESWQQIQFKVLQFQYNYKHIVDCIVNNWSFPIDLTFEQEVIVQHCLMYHHGLNLKTWQLEKFPNNTKDLHQLLEPLVHKLNQAKSIT